MMSEDVRLLFRSIDVKKIILFIAHPIHFIMRYKNQYQIGNPFSS